jgi:sarcosine oxidase subunit alpha
VSGFRLPAGGRVRRDEPLRLHFDGREHTGLLGDTLASALLAAGVGPVGHSIHLGRPRGIFAAGVEEPNALVALEGPGAESMLPATMVELYDDLRARGLSGRGRLEEEEDGGRYDRIEAHCDLLVVGAGPAGLAAALVAGRSGARVILADEQPEPGGSLLGTCEQLGGAPACRWVDGVRAELDTLPEVRRLVRTTVFGAFGHGKFAALERRTDHLGPCAPTHLSRQRVWHIRARRAVLATGAHERPIAFADNDCPGVMLAGAGRTYVNRYAVAPGRRVLIFTTNDSAYAAAVEIADAGVEVAGIVDARSAAPAWGLDRGFDVYSGSVVTGTWGEERLTGASIAGRQAEVECDALLVSGGWNPVLHLYAQAGGRLRFDDALAAFVPIPDGGPREPAGAARGLGSLADCLADGVAAAMRALDALAMSAAAVSLPSASESQPVPPSPLWLVDDPGPGPPWSSHFVDLQRDATVADVLRATRAGLRSLEHVKRYTTIGTGHDQGKTSGVLASAVVARELRRSLTESGTMSSRPPYTPVSFAALAGRERGRLFDPVLTTALHRWHVEHGAVFEDVGQWKRPRYYPRSGEDMDAAVARECLAARFGVAMMDASTLGTIDVQGPDAPEFLDRMYTNMISTVPVGGIRYGVMCRPDGMVFDDGTAIRLAADRYMLTTTTGGAAAVLEWLEQWLQTEWPQLRVHCTSVTDHWATVALVGPRSREVLSAVAAGLAVDRKSFPFMTWRESEVAGVPARVCRISFSGELAYEVNVSAWHALTLWNALLEAGEPAAITPYGTEAMHVLRAEKGYVIVGQDTDGTVTPQDLGMDWIVSKKKDDFLGKRSFSRPDTARADRRQLVGLLPADPELILREGTQLVQAEELHPPVRAVGHVTSSYRSVALGRTFAVGLLEDGHRRHGDTVRAVVGEATVAVNVTSPVLYDPEGRRRDG